MINFILQFLLGLVVFGILNYGTYWFTEKADIPMWLNYKPWICRKCCFFWTGLFTYTSIGIITNFQYLIFTILGIALVILNTLALYVDDKNKFIE